MRPPARKEGPARPARSVGWRPPTVVVVLNDGVAPSPLPRTPLSSVFPQMPGHGVFIASVFEPGLLTASAAAGIDLFGVAPPAQVYQLDGAPMVHLEHVARLLVARGHARMHWPRPRFGPLPSPAVDPQESQQGYRAKAQGSSPFTSPDPRDPWGVGIRPIEAKPECRGSGARVLIVERGWHLEGAAAYPQGHPDCPVTTTALASGANAGGMSATWGALSGLSRGYRFHGLANLGILVGTPANKGYGRGIAPAAEVRLHSSYDAAHPLDGRVYNALLSVVVDARPGDVVLVEEQLQAHDRSGNLHACMVERDPLVYILLSYLTQTRKALVVEPAGNGGQDLANLYVPFCTNSPIGFGSSAPYRPLVVGGARPVQRKAHYASNYGARVDVFGWHSNVYHIKMIDNGASPLASFQVDYGGTSAAAAIIAGAALVAQGMVKAVTGTLDDPQTLRQRLVSSSGVKTSDAATRPMGILPDLTAIASSLGL